MHGGALEIVYGPPSPPRNRQCRGKGAKPQGPARKTPNSSLRHTDIHHMIARDGLLNRPGSRCNAIAYLLDGV